MGKLTRRELRRMKSAGQGGQVTSPIIPVQVRSEEEEQASAASRSSHHRQSASHQHGHGRRHYKNKFIKFYDQQINKMQVVALLILLFSLGVIIYTGVTTGSIITRGTSLTGGQIITVTDPALDVEVVQNALTAAYPNAEISVRALSDLGKVNGLIIEAGLEADLEGILDVLRQWSPAVDKNYSVETIGSTLSSGFFSQVGVALILAFVFMSIVVFMLFKSFAPSGAVILAAFSDMVFTIAMIDLFGIKLSTAGIAALLMLIGYSVDTDILLTTRLLKSGKGDYLDRTIQAMKTGITMTACIIVTVVIGIIFAQSDVLRQIFIILLFGSIADIIFTYITNAHLLWWYMEKKGLKHK